MEITICVGPKAVELVLSLGHGTAKDFLIE